MRLVIKRDQVQQKGIFGGNKGVMFSLECHAQFTNQERALIERYQMGSAVLASYRFEWMDGEQELTVDYLINGFTHSMKNLAELIDLEKTIKDSCEKLHVHLKVAETFGGVSIIPIGDDEPSTAPPSFPTQLPAFASAPRQATPTRLCPRCGAQVREGSAFCGSCGEAVTG